MDRLVCPKCGWDASREGVHDFCFRFVEEITSIRRVEGINKFGALEIAGDEQIDINDPGAHARLQCGDCLTEFPIPDGLKLDFV